MRRYSVGRTEEGSRKYFYILDRETYDLVMLPTKFLKHKTDCRRSPNTVRRLAFSVCYYLEFLAEAEMKLNQVWELGFEEQSKHFMDFMYWIKEGNHREEKRPEVVENGTCNAYLKDVFGFFSFLTDVIDAKPLRVLSYTQITAVNSVGVKRTLRSKTFKGYLREQERKAKSAEESEITTVLQACTNVRDQLLILLMAETGFRIGEILGIDYTKDIDYQNQTIRVYFRDDNENNARAKNAEYRKAKISRDTFDFLMYYLNEYRKLLQHQTYLFITIWGSTAGSPLKVDSVYDMLGRMEKKTGIKLTPHMLRHYFANERWKAGWALELISQALGHKHLNTTITYLGVLDDKLMEASREFYEKHSDVYGIQKLL